MHVLIALLGSLGLGACQLATGLSELHPTSRPHTEVSPVEQACTSDDQCTSESASRCFAERCVDHELAQRWVCDEAEAETSTVRFSFRAVDFLTREPPRALIVNACRFMDLGCFAPVATFVDEQQTGHVQFTLPVGFTGFFEIMSDALPTLLYVTKAISRNTLERDVPIVSADAVNLTASNTGYSYDPELGLVLLEAIDCAGIPSGGVHFKLRDAQADKFYLVDQIPDAQAEVTVYDPNNNTANGGFLNVPPGSKTFSAHWDIDGIELQTFNAQVRASTITFIDMKF